MSSGKLGRRPASLSKVAQAAAADALPIATAGVADALPDAPPPAKKPRKPSVRKPKVVAEPVPMTAELAFPEPAAMEIVPAAAEPVVIAPPPAAEEAIVDQPPARPAPLRIRKKLSLPLPGANPVAAEESAAAEVVPASVAAAIEPIPAAAPAVEVPTPTTAEATPGVTPDDPARPASMPLLSLPAIDSPALPGTVIHRIHPVALGRKRDVLQHLLAQVPEQSTLVYTRTKHGADKIARFLERCGFKAAAIHGDKSQGARNRALAGFKSGDLKALVITDIAARLLDFEGLPMVLSYDLPHIAEDYAQRVRRTGTPESIGLAVTIITQEESPQFRAVRDHMQCRLDLVPLAGFEATEAFDPERDPLPQRGGGDADGEPAAAPEAAPAPPRRDAAVAKDAPAGRGRRDRRGRQGRNETRPRDVVGAPVAAAAVIDAEPAEDAEQPGDRQPNSNANNSARHARPTNGERPVRSDRPVRGDRHARRERPLRGDRQPGAEVPHAVLADDDGNDDRPGRGNSLAAPPPAQMIAGNPGRRRGRKDPFATVVVDEDRANIYDERQPDSYRDQWSVLGPDTGRPSWTYAEHQPPIVEAPRAARPAGPAGASAGPRRGPGGGGGARGPQQGQPRGQQRHGRPRRAEGR